ncbi:MAG: Ku protein [Planctomycetes bacterium]|nr:Ku protein [Planctomycetota bacterium]
MAVAQKGAITFALVYIPVELYIATQDNDIRFNQLSKKSKGRVRYKKVDEVTGKELTNDDIVKAYQYEKDKYVEVSDEDFESIKTERDRSIKILQFTDMDEISPVYYNRSYYVLPQKGGEKAFELLRTAMRNRTKVAIGQTVMGSNEVVMALIPEDKGILLETLYYYDEIKDVPKEVRPAEIGDAELDMADKIIGSMEKPFQPQEFHDDYQARLRELIESKIEGREISIPKQESSGNIINLMDALKASISDLKIDGKPARKPRARRKTGS